MIFPERLGKGGGIIEGFKVAAGDVAFTDADGATEAKELDKLIGTIEDCDVAIGSRWLDGSAVILNQPFSRRVAKSGHDKGLRCSSTMMKESAYPTSTGISLEYPLSSGNHYPKGDRLQPKPACIGVRWDPRRS